MTRKARAVAISDDRSWQDSRPGKMRALLARVRWPVKDLIVLTLAVMAALAILINALFLQAGPHPAPLFSTIIPTRRHRWRRAMRMRRRCRARVLSRWCPRKPASR